MSSIPIRIPEKDYREIRGIAIEMGITIGSAYQIWKNNRLNIKWKEY